jgi:aminoglycoside phosphotransferase (APT) family kinase protein
VHDDVVAELVAEQFPQWANRPLTRVRSTGTDNLVFRLGDDLCVRVPRIDWAVGQVAKEWEWLPRLAPFLPVAVPCPVAVGEPGCGFPHRWLVSRWLPGEDATSAHTDPRRLARDVAAFVVALESIAVDAEAPQGGRSGSLEARDDETRVAIAEMAGSIDAGRAIDVWDAGLRAIPWRRDPVWCHGDLLPGNLVVDDGGLAGVVDWAAAGVGDPACDAMVAWAMPPDARAVFRGAWGADDATWVRGRAWALSQAARFIPYYADTIPSAVAGARHRLDAILGVKDT